MRVLVTGVTGYIGSRLASLALQRGHNVSALSRSKPLVSVSSWIPFELSSVSSIQLPDGADAVVHLAANTTQTNCLEEKCEVIVAQRLIKSSQEVGAKFIFVSSQTARSDAPTAYGRTKWIIEQEVLSAGGWVVRPGQVYGGELRGLFGVLASAVHHLPLLPAFIPAPMIQPIHVDDLAEGLLRIAERGDIPPGEYCLAATEPVSFSKFLGLIAKARLRCWRGYIPVPIAAIKAISIVVGESWRTRLGLERLSSLFSLHAMETASSLDQLGLVLRPLHSGMHPSGNDRRRHLLREGRALLAYVLKEPPSSAVLRRYLRAIEQLRDGKELGLQQIYLNNPVLLSLIDKPAQANKEAVEEFFWRLDAATLLAEATPAGARRYLGREHRLPGVLYAITSAVVCELFWRASRLIISPLVRFGNSRARRGL